MGIDRTIITAISIVLFIFITVALIELVVPLAKNQAFNEECRSYLLLMEKQGGLLEMEISELTTKLERLGLKDIEVTAPMPGEIKYGEQMFLRVKVKCPIRIGAVGLELENRLQPFSYNRSVYCRGIELG